MEKVLLNAISTKFTFANVKVIVNALGINNTENSEVKKALKLIGIEDQKIDNLSLTAALDYDQEIRFFLKERVTRSFKALAKEISENNEVHEIEICAAANLNDNDVKFLKVLGEVTQVKVILTYLVNPEAVNYKLSENERKINITLLKDKISKDELTYLREQAENFISVGNAYDALTILNKIVIFDNSSTIWNELSLANTMVGNDYEAEFCLNNMIEFGTLRERAYADYSLAMLYARHHKGISLSLETAKKYLLDGLECLKSIHDIDSDKLLRDTLFTENGYALILFRTGELDEAIKIELSAIKQLESASEGTPLLQKSVLMYNLAQLYTKKRDTDNAIKVYKDLITLDSNFPECRMELAKNYIAVGDFTNAKELLISATNIEDSIPEVHSLLGFVGLSTADTALALKEYKKAYDIESRDPQNLYDYLYTLETLNMYIQAGNVIENVKFHLDSLLSIANSELKTDLLTAIVEGVVNNGKLEEANATLKYGLEIDPFSEQLKQNQILVNNAK